MIQQEHSAERLAEAAEVYLSVGRITRLLRSAGDTGALSPGSAAALGTLVRCGPMRLGDLAAAERVTAPTMSRIVAQLHRDGYIQRDPDPIDGRAHVLSATTPAQDMVKGLTSARIRRFADALERLPEDERRIMTATLARVVDLLDE